VKRVAVNEQLEENKDVVNVDREATETITKRKRIKRTEFPNQLRFYRKKYGYSQDNLASDLGKSQQQVSKLETGITDLEYDDIRTFLNIFKNISYDELFSTGRLSIVMNGKNERLVREYIKGFSDVFPVNATEYEKINIVANHILKMFLEGKLSVELRDTLREELSEV
jgi:transcriptional regulator with XRE-family HTH domain